MNKQAILKRPIPDSETLSKREAMLRTMGNLAPARLKEVDPVGLSPGNTKVGRTGSKFKTVFVWNIPAVLTCRGASQVCLQYCYNADDRKDVFPIDAWNQNLAWFREKPDILRNKINSQLIQADAPCAVRIHSSGDFFSIGYIKFWQEIACANPAISFWAYTRSWHVPNLNKSLEYLRKLANVELFASWDVSMKSPPPNWRLSIVTDDPAKWGDVSLSKNKLFLCPEQINQVANCASCGLCMKRDIRGVLFSLH